MSISKTMIDPITNTVTRYTGLPIYVVAGAPRPALHQTRWLAQRMKIQRTSVLNIIFSSLLLLFCLPASAYYDPGVQRWINRDPIGETGGIHLYRFVNNNPEDKVDAFGEKTAGDGRYGDCTKEQHNRLHSAVGTACKGSGKMKCFKSDDCAAIKSKIAKFDACIAARVLYNDTCWSSESSIENNEIKNARAGRQNCSDLSCQKNCN